MYGDLFQNVQINYFLILEKRLHNSMFMVMKYNA